MARIGVGKSNPSDPAEVDLNCEVKHDRGPNDLDYGCEGGDSLVESTVDLGNGSLVDLGGRRPTNPGASNDITMTGGSGDHSNNTTREVLNLSGRRAGGAFGAAVLDAEAEDEDDSHHGRDNRDCGIEEGNLHDVIKGASPRRSTTSFRSRRRSSASIGGGSRRKPKNRYRFLEANPPRNTARSHARKNRKCLTLRRCNGPEISVLPPSESKETLVTQNLQDGRISVSEEQEHERRRAGRAAKARDRRKREARRAR